MKVFEHRLHKNAVVDARYYGNGLALYVTYYDPPGFEPGKQMSIRLNLGDFKDGKVVPFPDVEDNLKEVEASYPEEWAKFCAALPDVYLAATVMED